MLPSRGIRRQFNLSKQLTDPTVDRRERFALTQKRGVKWERCFSLFFLQLLEKLIHLVDRFLGETLVNRGLECFQFTT
jgi:hypothetical protein